jgi:catechol 2,3-dioxygenase
VIPTDLGQASTPQAYGVRAPDPLPDGTHIGAVHLQVGDLERSLAYYTDVLGLRLLDAGSDNARLGSASAHELVVLHLKRGIRRAPRGGRYGLYHFAVLLPDRGSLGRFAAHLLRSGVQPAMADHAVSEALYLTDPDGLGIEVYADRPRSTWRTRGAELVMVTELLDLSAVIAAGENEPWSGVPEGTTMGHVHLHVGDIDRADTYYHGLIGFDKTVWSYPGALFLSAGGYHHHLGTNIWSAGPSASPDEARLLEWELMVPDANWIHRLEARLTTAGHPVSITVDGVRTVDPWGTQVHVRKKGS